MRSCLCTAASHLHCFNTLYGRRQSKEQNIPAMKINCLSSDDYPEKDFTGLLETEIKAFLSEGVDQSSYNSVNFIITSIKLVRGLLSISVAVVCPGRSRTRFRKTELNTFRWFLHWPRSFYSETQLYSCFCRFLRKNKLNFDIFSPFWSLNH